MERKTVFCRCGQNEHQLVLIPDLELEENSELNLLYICPCLADNLCFYKRVVLAIKYIFGHRSNTGMFGDLVLDRDGVKDLVVYLDKFLYKNQHNVSNQSPRA